MTQAAFAIFGLTLGFRYLLLPQSVEIFGHVLSGPLALLLTIIGCFGLYQLVCYANKLSASHSSNFLMQTYGFPVLNHLAHFCIGLRAIAVCFSYFLILKQWILMPLGIHDRVTQNTPYNLLFYIGLMALPSLMARQKGFKKLEFAPVLSAISVLCLSGLLVLRAIRYMMVKTPLNTQITQGLTRTSRIGDDLFSTLLLSCLQLLLLMYLPWDASRAW